MTIAMNNTDNILKKNYDINNKYDRCNQRIHLNLIEQINIIITKTGNRCAIRCAIGRII